MNVASRSFCALLVASISLYSISAFSDSDRRCRLHGSYGYLYNGTSYTQSGPVPLTETGYFDVNRHGSFSGVGILAFNFSDFGGAGPLWLLLRETQTSGLVSPDLDNRCAGTMEWLGTGTVIKTSNADLVPVGTILFSDSPRSIAYTISGRTTERVDMVSTSPGTIASGTAYIQNSAKRHH